jgi:Large polyvalent protein-associated domain 3
MSFMDQAIPALSDTFVPPLVRGTADLTDFAYQGNEYDALLDRIRRPIASHPSAAEEAAWTYDAAIAAQLGFRRAEGLNLQDTALAICQIYRVGRASGDVTAAEIEAGTEAGSCAFVSWPGLAATPRIYRANAEDQDGRRVHFSNEITEVNRTPAAGDDRRGEAVTAVRSDQIAAPGTAGRFAAIRKWALDNLRGQKVHSDALGADVTINRTVIDKALNRAGDDILSAIPAIPELIAKGERVAEAAPPRNPEEARSTRAWHTLGGSVRIDGRDVGMFIHIREDHAGHFFYNLGTGDGGADLHMKAGDTASLEAGRTRMEAAPDGNIATPGEKESGKPAQPKPAELSPELQAAQHLADEASAAVHADLFAGHLTEADMAPLKVPGGRARPAHDTSTGHDTPTDGDTPTEHDRPAGHDTPTGHLSPTGHDTSTGDHNLVGNHAPTQRVPLRLLALAGPGDLMTNTPLDFLTNYLNVRLDLLYVLPDRPLPPVIPDHDIAFFALGEADPPTLARLCRLHAAWPRPAMNNPRFLPALERETLSRSLAGVPGVCSPAAVAVTRAALDEHLQGGHPIEGFDTPRGLYPCLIRPHGSHAGRGLSRVQNPAELAGYLRFSFERQFFVTAFEEYSGPDGLYRKSRVAFIDRQPFLCHMAISSNWMVHYLNAGMTESADKRAGEASAMAEFDHGFARRHAAAFDALHARLGFDYYSIDCAETRDGRLLVFEADAAAIVHLMDPAELFPYKQPQMHRVFAAFEVMLRRRAGLPAATMAPGSPRLSPG